MNNILFIILMPICIIVYHRIQINYLTEIFNEKNDFFSFTNSIT